MAEIDRNWWPIYIGISGRFALELVADLRRNQWPIWPGIPTLLDVQGFPIKRHWYVVYPEGKQLSIVAQAFRDYLLQHSADEAMRKPQGMA